MAAYGWRKNHSVAEGLEREGHRFSFFQAVRLLERLFPERTPVAEDVDPDKEVVHFTSEYRQSFPASDVQAVKMDRASGKPAEMSVSFLGLAGVSGPLPGAYSELIQERSFRGDRAPRDFLDIFNHRLVSIFYRGRKKYRPPLGHETPDAGRVARVLLAFLGLGTPNLQGRLGIEDRSLLPYTGFFLGRRSMVALERFLADYFGFSVEVEPFQGSWHRLEDHQTTRLGLTGQNQVLGESAMLGCRVWDQEAGFLIHLGPLDLRQMLDLLPIAPGYARLCALVRFYAGDDFDFSFHYVLEHDEIPDLRLGQAGDARLGWSSRFGHPEGGDTRAGLRLGRSGDARLGWTTWLGRPDGDGELHLRGVEHRVGEETP